MSVTVNQAVRALRKHVGKTQQIFATELGISISSLNNYERQRIPEPKQLFAFARAARAVERSDLAEVFSFTAMGALGMWGDNWYEFELEEALRLCLSGGSDYQDIARTVVSALAAVVNRPDRPGSREKRLAFEKESVRRGYAKEVSGRVTWKGGKK